MDPIGLSAWYERQSKFIDLQTFLTQVTSSQQNTQKTIRKFKFNRVVLLCSLVDGSTVPKFELNGPNETFE